MRRSTGWNYPTQGNGWGPRWRPPPQTLSSLSSWRGSRSSCPRSRDYRNSTLGLTPMYPHLHLAPLGLTMRWRWRWRQRRRRTLILSPLAGRLSTGRNLIHLLVRHMHRGRRMITPPPPFPPPLEGMYPGGRILYEGKPQAPERREEQSIDFFLPAQ